MPGATPQAYRHGRPCEEGCDAQMKRRVAILTLVLLPALVAVVGFAADSGLLSFNEPRGAMPRVEGSEPSTGGFSSKNVEY